jgi:hypothetical protein
MRIFYFTGTGLKPTIWLILVLFTIGANAQTSDTPDVSKKGRIISSDEADLMDLDKAWIDAEVNHDKAALERILEDRFLATFASGKTVDRMEFIEGVMKMTISPFEVIHDVIRIHGDTALVIDLASDRSTKYTWIAIKRNGQWRVISETFTRVASPAK